MKFINNIKKYSKFILGNKKDWLAAFIVLAIGTPIQFSGDTNITIFNNIGSLLQTAGVLSTVYFSFSMLRRNRENALPKRLTVIFEYKGQEVMRCEQAYLAGESDIRQWGQQIGLQMNDRKPLNFEPYIEEIDKGVLEDENKNEYKLYQVVFHLREYPEGIKTGMLKKWERDANHRLKPEILVKSTPSVPRPKKSTRTRARQIVLSKS